ncbi:MAG: superoxide dismutase [Ni] [Planctomycetota bacterium]
MKIISPLRVVLACSITALAASLLFSPQPADAHCQVPCGIFDDQVKFAELNQHIDTIEKAMVQIGKVAGSHDAEDQQKLVRWVNTKEGHAQKIMDEAQEYFLAQRVKLPKDESEHEAYLAKLVSLHEVIVYAMKTKQTTNTAAVAPLRASLEKFEGQYFGKHEHTHTHDGEEHTHSHSHGEAGHDHKH